MSVILDALKRVQDENRRRGAAPVVPDAGPLPGPMHGSNALLRRLSAPEAPRVKVRRQPGPAVWIGALTAAGIAVVAVALWWMQPSFPGPRANDGRALLTDLTADPRDSVRFSPSSPAQGGAFMPTGSDLGAAALTSGAAPLPAAAANGEMSDLSANLPEAADFPVPARASASQPDSGFILEVGNRAAPSRGGVGGIDLTSDRPAPPSDRRPAPDRNMRSGEGVAADRGRRVPSSSTTLLDPGVRDAFAAGVRAQKQGDFGQAEESYKRALRHDPHNAKVNANLGVLYEKQGRLAPAERHLRQAVSVEPNNASVHNNLGAVLYGMGNYDGALIEFNRTLSLDPERLDAYTNKGLIFTRWGRYEDAERAFMQVLALNPDDPLANYNLGLVYEEIDNVERAVDHYYRFLKTGGADHPDVSRYLTQHLVWLEGRLNGGAPRR